MAAGRARDRVGPPRVASGFCAGRGVRALVTPEGWVAAPPSAPPRCALVARLLGPASVCLPVLAGPPFLLVCLKAVRPRLEEEASSLQSDPAARRTPASLGESRPRGHGCHHAVLHSVLN